jgi:hypothetical protein
VGNKGTTQRLRPIWEISRKVVGDSGLEACVELA